MGDANGPTYASLTPANPSIINGLANVDLVGVQTQQNVVNHGDPSIVNSMNVMNSENSPTASTAASSPAPNTPEIKSEMPDAAAMDKNTLVAVLQFLKKNGLQSSEDSLRKECCFYESVDDRIIGFGGEAEVSSVLSSYRNEGDPNEYEDAFKGLLTFIEKSLDSYKHEVSLVVYPVFVHMYLELVYNDHEEIAKAFLAKFGCQQEDFYQDDIMKLSFVTTRDHMTGYQIMDNFRASQFTVRMSRDSYSHLKRYLSERGGGPVPRIIQDRLYLDVYEGVPRTKAQVKATAGAFEGEGTREVNKMRIFHGLLKEPELQNLAVEEEGEEEDADKPKKKKSKKDSLQKNKKNDPNAPPNNRIPLPELRDIDKVEKAKAFRDGMKRVTLTKETLPSICFYTFLNAGNNITAVDICDDSSLLAYATSDSMVRVQTITPNKIRLMKNSESLNDIDKDADDVLVRMMDDRTAETTKNLFGHVGPVYACSFSPDKSLLLTAGHDGTIRLWSLQTWSCLVLYKGHIFPVWDVKFSPHGYYFVSGGHDRIARLWATDHHQPLRIFAGHYSDVDVVEFHPNSNYISTGSNDRSVRVWDVSNGSCVRILTGHKGTIEALSFSPCGRYLASAGDDSKILIWDLSQGHLVAEFVSHTSSVFSISFSRDGNILSSGGLDNCIKLWDFSKILDDGHDDDVNVSHNADVKRSGEALLLATFPSKHTPVLANHFTRRNVLLAVGPYEG